MLAGALDVARAAGVKDDEIESEEGNIARVIVARTESFKADHIVVVSASSISTSARRRISPVSRPKVNVAEGSAIRSRLADCVRPGLGVTSDSQVQREDQPCRTDARFR